MYCISKQQGISICVVVSRVIFPVLTWGLGKSPGVKLSRKYLSMSKSLPEDDQGDCIHAPLLDNFVCFDYLDATV